LMTMVLCIDTSYVSESKSAPSRSPGWGTVSRHTSVGNDHPSTPGKLPNAWNHSLGAEYRISEAGKSSQNIHLALFYHKRSFFVKKSSHNLHFQRRKIWVAMISPLLGYTATPTPVVR